MSLKHAQLCALAAGILVASGCGDGDDDPVVPDAATDASDAAAGPDTSPAPDAAMVERPCPGEGPQGRCQDDRLFRCRDGEPVDTDCTASGRVCAWQDDAMGYACVEVANAGSRLVHGVATYADRPIVGSELSDSPTALPVRNALVAVVQGADVLATAHTADDGSYRLHHDGSGEVSVVLSSACQQAHRPVKVTRLSGQIHAAEFTAKEDDRLDLTVPVTSPLSRAFNVLDNLVTGMDFVRNTLAVSAPVPLEATWEDGSIDGTYFVDSASRMFLLGVASDDDGYDDPVILHELGHYWEAAYGRGDSPGGAHDGTPTDPRLAWSEGFATYLSGVIRQTPLYADTNAGGGWVINMDQQVTTADPSGPITQDVSEDMVAEILWDAGDAFVPDDDPVDATHAAVSRVSGGYFQGGSWVDRGVSGVDLVDWLDGFFAELGTEHCQGMRDIVFTVRRFPYDFTRCL